MERVLELWKGMEEGRSNQATGMGVGPVGVALVTVVLRAGMVEEVERLIDGLFPNDAVLQNKRRNKMVESEERLLASQLCVRLCQWVELSGQSELRPLGPIELALEVWWQASEWQKWWEKNIRTPGGTWGCWLWGPGYS